MQIVSDALTVRYMDSRLHLFRSNAFVRITRKSKWKSHVHWIIFSDYASTNESVEAGVSLGLHRNILFLKILSGIHARFVTYQCQLEGSTNVKGTDARQLSWQNSKFFTLHAPKRLTKASHKLYTFNKPHRSWSEHITKRLLPACWDNILHHCCIISIECAKAQYKIKYFRLWNISK